MDMHHNFADNMQANVSFAVQQTAHIESQVYRVRYPELDYASMIPVDTSAQDWTKTVTYFSMNGAGKARWISGNGKDVPVVGTSMEKHETSVYTAGIGYSFGYEEVNHARMAGVSLESEMASYARRASEELIYNAAFEGDSEKNMEGLFSYTGVPTESTPADGASSSALWSAKTPDQILRDINKLLIGMASATRQIEMADTLIMPIERFQSLASVRLTDTSMTILEWIRSNNVYTATTGAALTIRGMRNLLTKGAGSTARMIAYRRSPEVLKMHVPMPHMFLPLQVEGLQFTIPGIFRLGGLDIRLPYAVRYMDGI
jgi:hypothetical protein